MELKLIFQEILKMKGKSCCKKDDFLILRSVGNGI